MFVVKLCVCQYRPVFRGRHRLHAAGNDAWRAQDCLSRGGRTSFLPAAERQIGPCGEVIVTHMMSYWSLWCHIHTTSCSLSPGGQWSETNDLRPLTSRRPTPTHTHTHTTEAVNGCWRTLNIKFIFIRNQSWFWRSGASDLYIIITVFRFDAKMSKNPEEIELHTCFIDMNKILLSDQFCCRLTFSFTKNKDIHIYFCTITCDHLLSSMSNLMLCSVSARSAC